MKKSVLALSLCVIMLFSAFNVFSLSSFADSGYFCSKNVFTDVDDGAYYLDAILYCYNYGYLSGTGTGTFSPAMQVSRSQIVTTLYSINDTATKYSASDFSDVVVGKWYFNPVEWAYKSGITSGTSAGMFSPNKTLTREEFAVFLMKFASFRNFDTTGRDDISKYSDSDKVSSWAKNALQWCLKEGIIEPTSGNSISPKMITDRAEMALCLKRFTKKYVHNWEIYRIVQNRTCTEDGVVTYKCSDCSKYKTVALKSWHFLNNGKCTGSSPEGCFMEYSCKICGEKISKVSDHKWESNPQHTFSGVYDISTYKCKRCGETFEYQSFGLAGTWDSYGNNDGNIVKGIHLTINVDDNHTFTYTEGDYTYSGYDWYIVDNTNILFYVDGNLAVFFLDEQGEGMLGDMNSGLLTFFIKR